MRSLLLFFMCLLCPTLYARDITYYCKKALHKSDSHSLAGIDYVYIINHHKDLNKFRTLKKTFQKYNITPYRFDAVDPMKLTYDTLKNIGFKLSDGIFPMDGLLVAKAGKNVVLQEYPMCRENSTYFNKQMTIWGIAKDLDLFSVIFDAYKSKYDAAWIMTDEVKVRSNPNMLSGYLVLLNEEFPDWDILYTDINSREHRSIEFESIIPPQRPDVDFQNAQFYKNRETHDYPMSQLGLRSGAYSFIISKKGMKKIVDYYKVNGFFIPIEIEMQIIPGIKSFIMRKDIVTN